MRIGFAAPVHLPTLGSWLRPGEAEVPTYSFPYMSELVKAYLERGHEVDVFSYRLDPRAKSVLGKGRLRVYLAERRRQPKFRALDRFRMERRQLATLIQAASPQVLHAHWTYEFAAAALATNLPTLVTAHDSPRVLRDNFGGYYWRQRAALGDRVLGNVQRLSAVSPELLEDLLASCPSLEDKSIVIPNGTATMNIGRPGGDFGGSFVSIANGFDERKNTRTLIEAFSMLKKNNPEASLTLFGSQHGPGEPAWRWATEHGLTRGVTFAGAVPPRQLGAWLAESPHCLVHVSRWEACSMALLEAQAIGIPIIGGSNSGGVAFTLGYGSAGLLVDITSSVAVASAMQRVVDEPGLRERLQERGIRLSRSQFALERVASAYLEELEKCTASS